MSNYETLKEKINKVIPSTKDWTIGNVIKQVKGENAGEIHTIGYDCWLKSNGALIELNDGYDYYLTDFELIGKELSLIDILIYIEYKDSDKDYFIDTLGQFFNYGQMSKSFGQWDLSKPHLKDQNPELLEWLSTLG